MQTRIACESRVCAGVTRQRELEHRTPGHARARPGTYGSMHTAALEVWIRSISRCGSASRLSIAPPPGAMEMRTGSLKH
jgi:hypothetical protein